MDFLWLGRRSYASGLVWQAWAMNKGKESETYLALEHDPVFTVGKAGGWDLFLRRPKLIVRDGIPIWAVGRGGKITYHGPGQLVVYPILQLNKHGWNAGRYLRWLEDLLIRLCSKYHLSAHRIPGKTGVWVKDAKIAAIGIRVLQGGTTLHGLAFNVMKIKQGFSMIVPCGLGDPVTSLQEESPNPPGLVEVSRDLAGALRSEPEWSSLHWVDASREPTPDIKLPIHASQECQYALESPF